MICELSGLLKYWKSRDKIGKATKFKINFELIKKETILDAAFEAYQKRLKHVKKQKEMRS